MNDDGGFVCANTSTGERVVGSTPLPTELYVKIMGIEHLSDISDIEKDERKRKELESWVKDKLHFINYGNLSCYIEYLRTVSLRKYVVEITLLQKAIQMTKAFIALLKKNVYSYPTLEAMFEIFATLSSISPIFKKKIQHWSVPQYLLGQDDSRKDETMILTQRIELARHLLWVYSRYIANVKDDTIAWEA